MADFDRFRSFAERYIVERAATFTKGKEREEAWTATLDAKTIYHNIARASRDVDQDQSLGQAGVGGGPPYHGVTSHGPSPGASGGLVGPGMSKHLLTAPPPTVHDKTFGNLLRQVFTGGGK